MSRCTRAVGCSTTARQADLSALAFLVGLRTAQLHDQAVGAEGHIGDIEQHQSRTAEGAGEADEQQCPIPHAYQGGRRKRLDHRPHLGGDGRVLLVWRRAERASDALEDQPHLGVRRRRDITSGLVSLRDAAQTAIQGRDFVRSGQVSEIQRDRLRGGWQELEAVQRAPFRKIGPVDAVRLQRVGRLGMGGVVAGAVGYLGKARQRPLLAVDRRIVILSGALGAPQPSFFVEHEH